MLSVRCRRQLASDVAAVDHLLDDEVVFAGPDGSLLTKEDDLGAMRSGQQVLTGLDELEVRARVIGSTGLTWCLLGITAVMGGQSVEARVRYTRTWTHTPKLGWQVVAAQATIVAAA